MVPQRIHHGRLRGAFLRSGRVQKNRLCCLQRFPMGSSMAGVNPPLDKDKHPGAAVVVDLLEIATSRLENDHVRELQSWTFLGQDIVRFADH
jgi:hypothetical protein